MGNINFTPVIFPKKEVVATCADCGKELARRTWGHYEDYNRQVRKIADFVRKCPKCNAVFQNGAKSEKTVIPWKRTAEGDYIAKAKNGDFLVWKQGYGWRWRYRKYGTQYPERINYAKSKEDAKSACEKHAEWKLEDKAV